MITEVQGFVGGAYSLPTRQIAAQECINLYLEKVEASDKEPAVLLGTPGMKLFNTYTDLHNDASTQNGLYTSSTGRLFRVTSADNPATPAFAAGLVLEILADGTTSPAAGIANNFGHPVIMADNGSWIFLAQNSAIPGRINMATLGVIGTADATITACAATHVAFLDGFFIINKTGTNQFYCSPFNWNGTDLWDPLSVGKANQGGGVIQGLIVSGRDCFIFTLACMEVWYDAGAATIPLQRNISIASNIGLYAKYSLAQTQGSVFWLGGGAEGYGIVYRTVGYTPTRISTHAIEREIKTYAGIDDAYGFTYQENGHSFYVLTFQTGNATWVYDLTSGQWHRRMYLNPTTGAYERWRGIGLAAFNGKTYILDRVNLRNVYQLDSSTYTDAGDQILRVRSSPHVHSNLDWITINKFQLDMQTGVGLTTGQGSDPQMILEYSKDGGVNWSSKQYRSMGKIGAYLARVFWNRLGKARDIVFRVSTSEPVKVSIMGAYVDVEA